VWALYALAYGRLFRKRAKYAPLSGCGLCEVTALPLLKGWCGLAPGGSGPFEDGLGWTGAGSNWGRAGSQAKAPLHTAGFLLGLPAISQGAVQFLVAGVRADDQEIRRMIRSGPIGVSVSMVAVPPALAQLPPALAAASVLGFVDQPTYLAPLRDEVHPTLACTAFCRRCGFAPGRALDFARRAAALAWGGVGRAAHPIVDPETGSFDLRGPHAARRFD
jgi:hypothetical protein